MATVQQETSCVLDGKKLTSKNALITGGTKGIGHACVKEFLALGARVAFVARTEATVSEQSASLQSIWGATQVMGLVGDMTVAAERERIVKEALKFFGENRIDVLVNNAGSNIRKSTLQSSI
eukprot:GHVN01099338.1.p2 GENE.GHVN01099338.1~~GHVN01099338.1.p2  ORF type:complete len:122 (-),score=6.56 GHVN01099338.1:240-605(-)